MINKKRTLLIVNNTDMYYFQDYKNDYIEICNIFKKRENVIVKVLKKLKFPFISLFYDKWYKKLLEYDKIIVFDIALLTDHQLLKNIRKKTEKEKLFLYSWNIAKNDSSFKFEMNQANKYGFTFYNYDKKSCKKYGLKHNTIMYDGSLLLHEGKIYYDALFLGYFKDRKEDIKKIYNLLIKAGLNPRVIIFGQKEQGSEFEFRSSYTSYNEYLEMLSHTRSIIDIAQKDQDGYSMRVMESLFLNKKLITTNKSIKYAEFYYENNIFIIENKLDDIQRIQHFFDLPYKEVAQQIKEKYDVEHWVVRFNDGNKK